MRFGICLVAIATIHAQEPVSPFDAPTVVFSSLTSVTSVGDFDADGSPDSLGWYWQSEGRFTAATVRIYLNRGAEGFRQGWNTTVPTVGPDTSWDTVTGELNNMPGDDLAFAFDRDVKVHVATLLTYNGQTWLTDLAEYAAWQEAFPVADLELADLDRDGTDDLVLIGDEVKVYRNTGTGMEPMTSYPLAGSHVYSLDFDGDGYDELMVPGSGAVTILRLRDGQLEVAGNLTHGIHESEGPMHVIGDIDRDDDPDIVVFSEAGEYVTLRCLAPEQFAIEQRRIGGPATDFADIDGDGDLDGVCCGGGGPGPGRNDDPSTYHISMNLGDGLFGPARTVEGVGAFRLAGAVDVDGDGALDLVAGRTVWYNRGGFAIDPQPDIPGTVPPAPLLAFDPDRDGDPDIALERGQLLRNDGAGNYTIASPALPAPPPGTFWHREGIRGDFDGDGDTDSIVGHSSGTAFLGMRLLLNAGGGAFLDGGYALPEGEFLSSTVPPGPWDRLHAIGDLDRDGDLDIMQGRIGEPAEVCMWLNDGAGHFVRHATYSVAEVPKRLVDLDADGILDLITDVGVWWGRPGLIWSRGLVFSGTVDPLIDHIAVGDIDGQGGPEIVYLEKAGSGRLMVVFNQGNRVLTELPRQNIYTREEQPRGVDIADLNGDQHPDLLVWPDYWGNGALAVVILFGDGNGYFPERISQVFDIRGPLVDVDGDGDLDALGVTVTRGAAAVAPRDGYRQQYGAASRNGSGMSPTLGARGPFTSGTEIELRVTGVQGGLPVVLGLATGPASIPNWPLPGLVGHISSPVQLTSFLASGPDGAPGAGTVSVPVAVPAGMAGQWAFLQGWSLDVSSGFTIQQTNGLVLGFK